MKEYAMPVGTPTYFEGNIYLQFNNDKPFGILEAYGRDTSRYEYTYSSN